MSVIRAAGGITAMIAILGPRRKGRHPADMDVIEKLKAHRIRTRLSERHVRVERDGVVLAESRPRRRARRDRPADTFLPAARRRPHGPADASETTSHCPFKGDATYFSAHGARDAFWVYEAPSQPAAEPVTGLLAPGRGAST